MLALLPILGIDVAPDPEPLTSTLGFWILIVGGLFVCVAIVLAILLIRKKRS